MTLKQVERLLLDLSKFHKTISDHAEKQLGVVAGCAVASHRDLAQECEDAATLVASINLVDPADRSKYQGE